MRRFWAYVLIVFEIGLIVSLARGIQVTLSSRERVDKLESERVRLEAEKRGLVGRLAYVKTQTYLDQVARDELHLAKEGETVVIVPEEAMPAGGKKQDIVVRERANWEKWWEVFFGKI